MTMAGKHVYISVGELIMDDCTVQCEYVKDRRIEKLFSVKTADLKGAKFMQTGQLCDRLLDVTNGSKICNSIFDSLGEIIIGTRNTNVKKELMFKQCTMKDVDMKLGLGTSTAKLLQ